VPPLPPAIGASFVVDELEQAANATAADRINVRRHWIGRQFIVMVSNLSSMFCFYSEAVLGGKRLSSSGLDWSMGHALTI